MLLPAGMLQKMSPWNAGPHSGRPNWNALTWDSIAYFYPARLFLEQSLRSGELPLWNPHQMCGTPFLADYQSATLYPPNWLFAVISAARAFGILAALHLFALGAFTFLFLRSLSLTRIPSAFGAAAFMLSGFAITWLELPGFISTGVWLPLALYFVNRTYGTNRTVYAAGAGVALGLSLLGGHPQIAFYVWMAVGLYWAYLAIAARSFPWPAILAFGIGLALAAPQLLPSMELAKLSHRGGSSPTPAGYAAYSALAMPWRNLITFLIPDFFGTPLNGTFWGAGEYAEYCGYVGILPLILALLAFGRKESRKQAWFFAGLAALALLMALGTGINRLFYFGLPGFARSGSPARALFLFMFSAAVLGGIGLDRILNDEKKGLLRILLSGLGLIVFGLAVFIPYIRTFCPEMPREQIFQASLPAMRLFPVIFALGVVILALAASGKIGRRLGGILAIGILAADLLAFGMWYNPTSRPSEVYPPTMLTNALTSRDFARIMPLNDRWPLRRFPSAVLPPNSAAAYGLYDVQGYDSFYPVRYKQLLDAAAGRDSSPQENGNMVFARNPGSRAYDLLGVRWIIGRRDLFRNPRAFPRAFLVHAIEYYEDQDILHRIAQGDTDLRSVALANIGSLGRLDAWQRQSQAKPAARDRVTITRYRNNSVTMEVEAAEAGILVLTDQYYPGWQAKLDGKPVHIEQVDYVFRGVVVPAGKHTVAFVYRPQSFRQGCNYAATALILLIGIGLNVASNARRSRRP